MKQSKSLFSFKKRLFSFKYAFNGIKILIQEEHNSRIHLAATIAVITISIIFNINRLEWIGIVLSIGIVIVAEIINSAIENICSFISPEKHETIKRIKDLSAAAVLVAALIAVIVAGIVFLPKL